MRIETVDDAVAFQGSVSNASAMRIAPLDLPGAVFVDQAHVVSAAPPLVEFAGQRNPHFGLAAKLGKASEQGGVDVARAPIQQIIGVNDETDQAVLLQDQFDLLLPKIHGVLAQDVEKSVVLSGNDRNFQNFSDEVRLGGAAATALGIEVADVGNGHVVGIIKEFVPVEIAIKNAGAVADRAELAAVFVDAGDAAKKFFAVAEQVAIMIEVVDVNLETAVAEALQIFVGDIVAAFRDDLKGTLDAEGVVKIHEFGAEVAAGHGFDVVRDDRGTGVRVGPKPDEGNGLAGICANHARHHAVEEAVDGLVDRPARKTGAIPTAQRHALEMLADGGGQEWAHSVVGFAADRAGDRAA